tara:strand:+ start:412 stop:1266 length:855 start_codon:yes stop_codon:yes gene_type:complete
LTKPTSKFLNKDDLDRFYTKPSVVDNLLNEITLEDYDVVVEPSAGTGSWSSKIDDCVAIDISPEHPDIMKGNFLEDDFLFDEMKKENKILVIGNPPFGRIGNKAIKFINKAAEFADTIAFILPRSFRKESLQRKINKNFWLVKDIDLFEESCFIFKGEDYFAPCVFQVWERREEERNTKVEKIDPVGWSYAKHYSKEVNEKKVYYVNTNEYNLVVRRVGGAAGTAYTDDIKEKSVPPNYFLWVDNPKVIADSINKHEFNIHDTVGPESLTKGELTIFINSLTKS